MAKTTCEQAQCIPISLLKNQGFLSPGTRQDSLKWTDSNNQSNAVALISHIQPEHSFLELKYFITNPLVTLTDPDQDYPSVQVQHVPLVKTTCFLGGSRYWYLCPFEKDDGICRRKLLMLYVYNAKFGCRKCLDLIYTSQKKEWQSGSFSRFDHLIEKIGAIERKISARRTKFFKGHPTKYYVRILKKADQLTRFRRLADEQIKRFEKPRSSNADRH